MEGVKIGILAIQGSFAEHVTAFKKLGNKIKVIEIRRGDDLTNDINGLVIPGNLQHLIGVIIC